MPLTQYALDEFVAQDLSKLTECRAPSIEADFEDRSNWLNNFVLNAIFKMSLPKEKLALALALIRRADGAVQDYGAGRLVLESMANGERTVKNYFDCLRKFESSAAMTYQTYMFTMRFLPTKLFKPGDGSAYQRLNDIYNKGRHEDPEKLPKGHLHAVWITNDGLCADGALLGFDELADQIREIGSLARKLSNAEVPPST